MSKKKPLPTGIKLITQMEMVKLYKVPLRKINALSRCEQLGFPRPVHTGAHRLYLYNRAEIDEWMSRHDVLTMKRPWIKSAARKEKENDRNSANCTKPKNREPFNNHLALQFICGCLDRRKPRIVKASKNAQTNVVHIAERNDYVPPNTHLTLLYKMQYQYSLNLTSSG